MSVATLPTCRAPVSGDGVELGGPEQSTHTSQGAGRGVGGLVWGDAMRTVGCALGGAHGGGGSAGGS